MGKNAQLFTYWQENDSLAELAQKAFLVKLAFYLSTNHSK